MGKGNGIRGAASGAALGLLLGLSFGVQAQTAQDIFQQGLAAARAGDSQTALSYFERAREAGLASGALFYNLGVTHYRLGQYPQARDAFERLTGHPTLGPLAWYNLGLVALKSGDRGDALTAFRQAQEQAPAGSLQKLAAGQVSELQAAEETVPGRWAGALSLGAGRDDALQDPVEQVATETSDEFSELFALGTGVIAGEPQNGWRLDLSAYAVRYRTFDEFDMSVLTGALTRAIPAGKWRLEVGAGGERSTFGGEPYLQEGQLRLTARLPEGGGHTGYRFRYRYHEIQSLDTLYDPQEGSRHDLDLEARWIGEAGRLALIYGLEVNDREDFVAPGLFTSYSPTRNAVGLRADTDVGRWRWSGEVEYRYSEYADPNRLADGRVIDREDERVRGALGVDYRLTETWQLSAEYSRTDNDSNIDDYDYEQDLVTAGLTAFF